MGKYNAVLRRYGKSGFGVPTKAPDVGSFPLYPLNRARYALTIIASPTYDSKTSLRARIAKRAIAAHPSLRSYWSQLNRETIKPRLSRSTRPTRRKAAANPRRNTMARRRNTGRIRILKNPYGLRMGKGKAIRVVGGKRAHMLNPLTGYALCGAGKNGNVKSSDASVITCYRCIKIHVVDEGSDVERRFKPGPGRGKRQTHMMVPGGRQGRYVSGRKPSDVIGGIDMFLGGDFDQPTQPRTLTARQKAARRRAIRDGKFQMVREGAAVRRKGEMVANPRSYKQGYTKGRKDYRSAKPTPASQLKQRTMSYQSGYLEGYADSADKKYSKPRKSTRRRAKARRSTRRRRR